MYYTAAELRGVLGSYALDADRRLREASFESRRRRHHDVFLSHCRLDAAVILGVMRILEAMGLSVYVDWIDDPQLDRTHVTPTTADHLRVRMEESKSLVYAYSRAATRSTWMPWELGYFDGRKGSSRVAVCPIDSTRAAVSGQEYVGLYKTFEKVPLQAGHRPLFVSATGRSAQRGAAFVNGLAADAGIGWLKR